MEERFTSEHALDQRSSRRPDEVSYPYEQTPPYARPRSLRSYLPEEDYDSYGEGFYQEDALNEYGKPGQDPEQENIPPPNTQSFETEKPRRYPARRSRRMTSETTFGPDDESPVTNVQQLAEDSGERHLPSIRPRKGTESLSALEPEISEEYVPDVMSTHQSVPEAQPRASSRRQPASRDAGDQRPQRASGHTPFSGVDQDELSPDSEAVLELPYRRYSVGEDSAEIPKPTAGTRRHQSRSSTPPDNEQEIVAAERSMGEREPFQRRFPSARSRNSRNETAFGPETPSVTGMDEQSSASFQPDISMDSYPQSEPDPRRVPTVNPRRAKGGAKGLDSSLEQPWTEQDEQVLSSRQQEPSYYPVEDPNETQQFLSEPAMGAKSGAKGNLAQPWPEQDEQVLSSTQREPSSQPFVDPNEMQRVSDEPAYHKGIPPSMGYPPESSQPYREPRPCHNRPDLSKMRSSSPDYDHERSPAHRHRSRSRHERDNRPSEYERSSRDRPRASQRGPRRPLPGDDRQDYYSDDYAGESPYSSRRGQPRDRSPVPFVDDDMAGAQPRSRSRVQDERYNKQFDTEPRRFPSSKSLKRDPRDAFRPRYPSNRSAGPFRDEEDTSDYDQEYERRPRRRLPSRGRSQDNRGQRVPSDRFQQKMYRSRSQGRPRARSRDRSPHQRPRLPDDQWVYKHAHDEPAFGPGGQRQFDRRRSSSQPSLRKLRDDYDDAPEEYGYYDYDQVYGQQRRESSHKHGSRRRKEGSRPVEYNYYSDDQRFTQPKYYDVEVLPPGASQFAERRPSRYRRPRGHDETSFGDDGYRRHRSRTRKEDRGSEPEDDRRFQNYPDRRSSATSRPRQRDGETIYPHEAGQRRRPEAAQRRPRDEPEFNDWEYSDHEQSAGHYSRGPRYRTPRGHDETAFGPEPSQSGRAEAKERSRRHVPDNTANLDYWEYSDSELGPRETSRRRRPEAAQRRRHPEPELEYSDSDLSESGDYHDPRYRRSRGRDERQRRRPEAAYRGGRNKDIVADDDWVYSDEDRNQEARVPRYRKPRGHDETAFGPEESRQRRPEASRRRRRSENERSHEYDETSQDRGPHARRYIKPRRHDETAFGPEGSGSARPEPAYRGRRNKQDSISDDWDYSEAEFSQDQDPLMRECIGPHGQDPALDSREGMRRLPKPSERRRPHDPEYVDDWEYSDPERGSDKDFRGPRFRRPRGHDETAFGPEQGQRRRPEAQSRRRPHDAESLDVRDDWQYSDSEFSPDQEYLVPRYQNPRGQGETAFDPERTRGRPRAAQRRRRHEHEELNEDFDPAAAAAGRSRPRRPDESTFGPEDTKGRRPRKARRGNKPDNPERTDNPERMAEPEDSHQIGSEPEPGKYRPSHFKKPRAEERIPLVDEQPEETGFVESAAGPQNRGSRYDRYGLKNRSRQPKGETTFGPEDSLKPIDSAHPRAAPRTHSASADGWPPEEESARMQRALALKVCVVTPLLE